MKDEMNVEIESQDEFEDICLKIDPEKVSLLHDRLLYICFTDWPYIIHKPL